MKLNKSLMKELSKEFGDAFYLLDSVQFEQNYRELEQAFKRIFPNFSIAYSYKTNYIPKLCKIVDKMGGYAEVVSDMEMEIALRSGVSPKKIIWNGPYKNLNNVEKLLVEGGTVNLDSAYEIDTIKCIAAKHTDKTINIGVRCNFDIEDGVLSRFGFDVESEEFKKALKLTRLKNIHLAGLQCHFATRSLETWVTRTDKMLKLINSLGIIPEHIDFGGGLYGKMSDSLKVQFNGYIPSYEEYAQVVATRVANNFAHLPEGEKPLLLIEPGSALVGDCMRFAAKVINIKTVREKSIATLLGSIYNINPTLNKKNPPIEVIHMGEETSKYVDLDFGGFTCIESDYLYRNYCGALAVGDYAVFGNVGSYSVVLKPPFILPNFPIIDICGDTTEIIKAAEKFDDIFQTYLCL